MVKFNSGKPAIICDKCRRIFRYIRSKAEVDEESKKGKKHYCERCSNDRINKQ